MNRAPITLELMTYIKRASQRMDLSACLRASADGALLDVYVQPKASRNELVGLHHGSLKIRLTAPPVEGAANKECIKFLARLLGAPKSDIEIIQGHKSRQKTVLIRGLAPEVVQNLLKAGEIT